MKVPSSVIYLFLFFSRQFDYLCMPQYIQKLYSHVVNNIDPITVIVLEVDSGAWLAGQIVISQQKKEIDWHIHYLLYAGH